MTTTETLTPARGVPPGRILMRELDARGWTQRDLAQIMERPPQAINEIVKGSKQITPETALELSEAFGTSPEFWTNLEANYRLFLARQEKIQKDITRRSRLYSLAPIPELITRSWIKPARSTDQLEKEVCAFLGIASPDETPVVNVSLRHTQERGPEHGALVAWVKRVEHLARLQRAEDFEQAKLKKAIPEILSLASRVEDAARVPSALLNLGVRFVIVPHLPKTFVDGAVLYLDKSPVVALSLRYDRIDAFWFTLMHELAHIVARHREIHLDVLYGADNGLANVSGQEQEANNMACDWLVDQEALDEFIEEVKPYFSKSGIERFAQSQHRHPGIVLGQLHHRKAVDYKNLRSLLVKVSPFVGNYIDTAGVRRGRSN